MKSHKFLIIVAVMSTLELIANAQVDNYSKNASKIENAVYKSLEAQQVSEQDKSEDSSGFQTIFVPLGKNPTLPQSNLMKVAYSNLTELAAMSNNQNRSSSSNEFELISSKVVSARPPSVQLHKWQLQLQREDRKLSFWRSLWNKPKVSPLFLVNGTVCRFINSTPICTTLQTTGLLPTNGQPNLNTNPINGNNPNNLNNNPNNNLNNNQNNNLNNNPNVRGSLRVSDKTMYLVDRFKENLSPRPSRLLITSNTNSTCNSTSGNVKQSKLARMKC